MSNDEVLNPMDKEVEVLYNLKRRRLQYFGHVLRKEKYRLLQLVMEGKIQGRRRPRRRKTSWIKNLRNRFGTDSVSTFCSAASKVRIALIIANLWLWRP